MSDEDRRVPEPTKPDTARLVHDEHGRARLVPDGDIIEGELGECAPTATPPSP